MRFRHGGNDTVPAETDDNDNDDDDKRCRDRRRHMPSARRHTLLLHGPSTMFERILDPNINNSILYYERELERIECTDVKTNNDEKITSSSNDTF